MRSRASTTSSRSRTREGNFIETDKTNNTAWTSFRLTRDSKGNAKISEISHSPCSGWQCGENLQNR